MESLCRFRIVKLSNELQQEFALPALICANPESLVFPEGQGFYRWVVEDNACESNTAHNYLQAVLPFLTFLWFGSPSLRYNAPAEQLRHRVRDYLTERLGCAVRPHRSGNFQVRVSRAVTGPSVRLFLTALKQFYACAIVKGWYTEANPLVWTAQLMPTVRLYVPKMPPSSGMTLPEDRQGRMPETYFCVVSGDWQPRILDDPNLPKRLLAAFAEPRDRLIARILFESGARIGEVLGLTLGDWRSRGLRERALAANKGSRGARVKEIWWSNATAQSLRNYVGEDRRFCDPRDGRLEDLPDSAELFLTRAGRPYSYAAFYANWRQACRKAQLRVTPHQARHWFVTMALCKFESLVGEKRDAARQALVAYMGWRNPDTLQAYDHHLRQSSFAPIHAALARLVETGVDDPGQPSSPAIETLNERSIL